MMMMRFERLAAQLWRHQSRFCRASNTSLCSAPCSPHLITPLIFLRCQFVLLDFGEADRRPNIRDQRIVENRDNLTQFAHQAAANS